MRRRLLALASALALAAMTAAPAAAITKNFRDDDEHPFVGLVAFYDANWGFLHRCTGELLSPTVLLTAGHCPDDGLATTPAFVNAAHARVWFNQDVASQFDGNVDARTGYPNSCSGTLGNGLGTWCATGDTMFNYGFNNFAGLPNIHDLGIVILDQPIAMPEYASLATAGAVETLQTARGTQDPTMRVSGYGLSLRHIVPAKGPNAGGAPSTFTVSYRIRLQADMAFKTINSTFTDGYAIKAEGNGDDQGGTCNGDSGGPVFWPAESNRVVAVSSWGILNAGCRGVGYYYRTDRTDTLAWIRSVVGESRWSEITVE
jgi:secreted trypsin-like serine protease